MTYLCLLQVQASPLVLGWREGWTIFVAITFISLSYYLKDVLSKKPAEHMQTQAEFSQGVEAGKAKKEG